MDKPVYRKKPIGRVDSLAKFLSVATNNLINLADKVDSFYYLNRLKKEDGSFRDVYAVKGELKSIQNRILERIYTNVYFPNYLYGSLKGTNHILAAKVHLHAKLSVRMDISKFFPSLNSKVIFDIWKCFFHFSEPVAKLLTKLTTLNGFLPQGASTSPYLSNLAFWDTEFAVVDYLQRNGFTYTRFVDDVTVSSKKYTEMRDLKPIFDSIFGMFRAKGVKPNRKKTNISTSGHSMTVLNLDINSGVLTLPKVKRNEIIDAVKECERNYQEYNQSENYEKSWESARGKVNYLNQLHPSEAQTLLQRLQAVRPV